MQNPYAGYPYSWHIRRFGGPSRLIWFGIGAFAATWYHHNKGQHLFRRHCQLERPSQNANSVPLLGSGQDRFVPPPVSDPAPAHPTNSEPRWSSWGFPNPTDDRSWEEYMARVNELRKQAHETVSELSESTLDGVISTVESLKIKLAEHRAAAAAEREIQLRKMEEEGRRIEQQRMPRHVV